MKPDGFSVDSGSICDVFEVDPRWIRGGLGTSKGNHSILQFLEEKFPVNYGSFHSHKFPISKNFPSVKGLQKFWKLKY